MTGVYRIIVICWHELSLLLSHLLNLIRFFFTLKKKNISAYIQIFYCFILKTKKTGAKDDYTPPWNSRLAAIIIIIIIFDLQRVVWAQTWSPALSSFLTSFYFYFHFFYRLFVFLPSPPVDLLFGWTGGSTCTYRNTQHNKNNFF